MNSSHLSPELQQQRFLTEREVAALTGRAVQSLRNDRSKKQGFVYVKFCGMVRYRLLDVLTAMESHRIETESP